MTKEHLYVIICEWKECIITVNWWSYGVPSAVHDNVDVMTLWELTQMLWKEYSYLNNFPRQMTTLILSYSS